MYKIRKPSQQIYVTETAYTSKKYGKQSNQRLFLIFHILKLFFLTTKRNAAHNFILISTYYYAMLLLISHYPPLFFVNPLDESFPPSKKFPILLS